jgi:hypothetical protein
MVIDKLWPYIPTPIVYLLLLVEAAAALFIGENLAVVAMLLILSLFFAVLLGAAFVSRPFHVERLLVLLTLSIAQAAFFGPYLGHIHHTLHLHDESTITVARILYGFLWVALAIATLIVYVKNRGRGVHFIVPLLILVAAIIAAFPIEPGLFISRNFHHEAGETPHEPEEHDGFPHRWLWLSRLHLAIILFVLITVADYALLQTALYYDFILARGKRSDARWREPSFHDLEMPLLRTLAWSPLTIWVIYVPRWFLLLVLPLVPFLIILVYRRWIRVREARLDLLRAMAEEGAFVSMTTAPRSLHSLETIVDMASALDSAELKFVLGYLQPEPVPVFESYTTEEETQREAAVEKVRSERSRHHRPRRKEIEPRQQTAVQEAAVQRSAVAMGGLLDHE